MQEHVRNACCIRETGCCRQSQHTQQTQANNSLKSLLRPHWNLDALNGQAGQVEKALATNLVAG
jgi:hypothetical protein